MTHRPDWHDYEVEPDRIVRRKRDQKEFWCGLVMACAIGLAAYSIAFALFMWGW